MQFSSSVTISCNIFAYLHANMPVLFVCVCVYDSLFSFVILVFCVRYFPVGVWVALCVRRLQRISRFDFAEPRARPLVLPDEAGCVRPRWLQESPAEGDVISVELL